MTLWAIGRDRFASRSSRKPSTFVSRFASLSLPRRGTMWSLACWRYWSIVERSLPSASTRLIHLSQASATVMDLLGAVCCPRLTLIRVLAAWSSASPLVWNVVICRTPFLSKQSTIHASLDSPFRVVHVRLRTDIAALHCYVAVCRTNIRARQAGLFARPNKGAAAVPCQRRPQPPTSLFGGRRKSVATESTRATPLAFLPPGTL